ncbi:MAG: phage tail tube protein [Terracidiphilus sp.]|nr:phage tail tube protein [Terracidiphilus sp.]
MPGPFNFESQWKSARNLVLSANRQLAWNAALADAALTQRQRFDGGAVLELTKTRRTDIDYAGKGTAFATNGQATSFDTKLSGFKAEGSPWTLGWCLAFLMGKDTVVGAVSPYTHTFTFDESTRTAVPTTIYMEDTEALKYKVPDFCLSDVTITINEVGAVMVEMNGIGTGRQIMGAMAILPALAAESYVLGSDATLQFGPVGALQNLTGRHMSTTLKLDNQASVHKAPGGGQYGIFVRKGNPKFSLTTTIAAKDVDDVYLLHQNDTASGYNLTVNSGAAAQLAISIPQMQTKTTKLGFDGEMEVWQIEADETTCNQVAGVPPVSLQVISAVAAYLVGA